MSKLVSKERVGAKVRKRYDEPRTPYQRVLAAGVLSDEHRRAFERLYARLNPVQLPTELEAALQRLWRLAEPPQPLTADPTGGPPEATHPDATRPGPGAARTPTKAALG